MSDSSFDRTAGTMYILAVGDQGQTPPMVGIFCKPSVKECVDAALSAVRESEKKHGWRSPARDTEKIISALESSDGHYHDELASEGIFMMLKHVSVDIQIL